MSIYDIKIYPIYVESWKILQDYIKTKDESHTFPLISVYVEWKLKDVDIAVSNGMRRVVLQENIGVYMDPGDGLDISIENADPYMVNQFVSDRIKLVPIRYDIPKDTKLSLYVKNPHQKVLSVYTKDLKLKNNQTIIEKDPIFNPGFELATLQPGKAIKVDNICIKTVSSDAKGQIGCGFVSKPIDLEEHDKKETHTSEGKYVDCSGFKQSTMIAKPRNFYLYGIMQAIPRNRIKQTVESILIDICNNIMDRLNDLRNQIDNKEKHIYTEYMSEDGWHIGELKVKDETITIGRLISNRIINDYDVPGKNNLSFCASDHLRSTNEMTIKIKYIENTKQLIFDSIEKNIKLYENIRKQIREQSFSILDKLPVHI